MTRNINRVLNKYYTRSDHGLVSGPKLAGSLPFLDVRTNSLSSVGAHGRDPRPRKSGSHIQQASESSLTQVAEPHPQSSWAEPENLRFQQATP